MSHKHGHDKHNHHGKGGGSKGGRDGGRKQPIGMVQQRSLLATFLAFGLILFVVLAILTVIAYMIWG